MKSREMKRLASAVFTGTMVLALAACGGTKTQTDAPKEEEKKEEATEEKKVEEDPNCPKGVSQEDWAAMKAEPIFGQEVNYLYNGGSCVSAIYMAEELGYYAEYGINATYLEGGDCTTTVGTGKCAWGTDHIATMLVPVTNGVDMTFVCGAHVGCKSIFVPANSDIKSVSDLKGKKIVIHDGIGNSDMNICYRLIDEYGLDPTKEVEFTNIDDSAATITALQNGEAQAAIFSDYFVLANYPDDLRMLCSITYSPEFQDEPCCVTAMNNDFLKNNPVHAKYIVKAIKRAGMYNRLNSTDAVQTMIDTKKMTGKQDLQMQFWDSLNFGLSDKFTETALREIAEDYIRLGIITNKKLTADDVMKLAWTEVCPDSEMDSDYTVSDPVKPKDGTVAVKALDKKHVVVENFGKLN